MEYTHLGKSGLKVSRLCLGMMTYGSSKWRKWVLDEEQALPFVKRALEAGINFFDTADMYSAGASEEVLGNTLRTCGVKRESVVVATKVFNPMSDEVNDRGLSRKHIMDSIDHSLQRLKMEYVDLYQIHRWDYTTPIEETMEALNDVVKSGRPVISRIFHVRLAVRQGPVHADLHGWRRFVSMQNHYNLVYREEEREMIPLCIDQAIGLIPWSPMARGFFGGNRHKQGGGETVRAQTDDFAGMLYYRPEDFSVADRAWEVAKAHNATGSQIALAWILSKPYVTAPIVGASKLEHLDQSIAALEIKLAPEQIKHLEELYQPHPVLGHS